jgi:signal transduction histidine kinase
MSFTGAIRDLLREKGQLVQNLVTEGEEVRSQIAREIHDEVINDILALRRSLAGDRQTPVTNVVGSLDEIASKLRRVCYDLAPRDLRDWGLRVVLKDLLGRLQERTGAQCDFESSPNFPRLSHEVELQIYRIMQECLNNIEKHARATAVKMTVLVVQDTLQFTVKDNGIGFDPAKTQSQKGSCQGSSIIRERAELISVYHPTDLTLTTVPQRGTEINLYLKWNQQATATK